MLDYKKITSEYTKSKSDKTGAFFVEEYLSTFNAHKGRDTPFTLFPRQKVFMESLINNPKTIAIKHRQAGITTVTSAWVAEKIALADKDRPETILCIGNKLDLSQQLLFKMRAFLEQVPRWYWGEEYYSDDPKSEKNKKSIFTKASKSEIVLFNGCSIYARSSGENAARGISAVSILIFDEAAFIENGLSVYSSAVAATASYGDKARIVMISTPNGKDELYYNTYRQALTHENGYTAVEFKWFQDPRYNRSLKWYKKNSSTGKKEWYIEETTDSEGSIAYDEDHWRKMEQDGWWPTSPWYETMCQSFNNDTKRIAQELEVSFLGSTDNVVSSEYIEMQNKLNVREPLADMKDPMEEATWFWKPPIPGHRYILSIDPSRGVSNDRTAIEVIDADGRDEDGMPIVEEVMEYLGKKLGDDVGAIAYNYARLYNNAYIIVDCTGGQGDGVILTLLRLGYKNLYYEDDVSKTYMLQNKSSENEKYTDKLPGFHFQGSRYTILSNFAGMVRNNEFKIRSARVINELDTWIFKGENARMDHMNGAHDDTITCLAMALFVLRFSFAQKDKMQHKDKAILGAYMTNRTTLDSGRSSGVMTPKNGLPFYSNKSLNTVSGNVNGSCLWLLGGYRQKK